MKTCPNCNASVPDEAKFCPKCRFNIKKYEDEKQNKVLYCIECGAKISNDASFCIECGADVVKVDIKEIMSEKDKSLKFDNINGLYSVAMTRLFESNGLMVENGVLLGYTGKKRSVTIFGSIEEIYDGAFKGNDFVAFIEIQEGVKIIGKEAFASCSSLVEINIPSSCKKIYEKAFDGVNLETLILPRYDKETLLLFLSENAKKHLTNVLVKLEGLASSL